MCITCTLIKTYHLFKLRLTEPARQKITTDLLRQLIHRVLILMCLSVRTHEGIAGS